MLLWVVFALMSAGVVVALLHPLMTRRDRDTGSAEATAAVYRDQLAEIDAEAQRGLIGGDEAEAARREIARRILASTPTAEAQAIPAKDAPEKPASGGRPRAVYAAVATVLLPIVGLAIYSLTGNPGLPSQPHASRAPPVSTELAKLVGAVEARLKAKPDDGRGWDVIAPVYLRMERYADAADAYTNAIRFLGENPQRLSGLADASMMRDGGRVGPEARRALTRLLALDPGHVQARFWLAFAQEQDGNLAEAESEYAKLLKSAPSGAPWRSAVEERLSVVRAALSPGGNRPPAEGSPARGPSSADIAAAERLSPKDRQAMIDGMVSGLAKRLETDGRNLEGWRKLIRALTVLGRKDEALAALGRARKSLADEPPALASLDDLAKSLGLGT